MTFVLETFIGRKLDTTRLTVDNSHGYCINNRDDCRNYGVDNRNSVGRQ